MQSRLKHKKVNGSISYGINRANRALSRPKGTADSGNHSRLYTWVWQLVNKVTRGTADESPIKVY